MDKLRVYADTSVFGGCFDKEFAAESRALLDMALRGEIVLLISYLLLDELRRAPVPVKEVLIASWNFKHLVHYEKIRKFNGVNLVEGYTTVDIRSPLEIV